MLANSLIGLFASSVAVMYTYRLSFIGYVLVAVGPSLGSSLKDTNDNIIAMSTIPAITSTGSFMYFLRITYKVLRR